MGNGFPLTPVVGLVIGANTDEAAVREVEQALNEADVKRIVRKNASESAPNTPVTIWIGGPEENQASLEILQQLNVDGPGELKAEGYVVASKQTDKKRIVLAGKNKAGTFYAAQTFEQLIQKRQGRDWIPEVEIRDWPEMAMRGSIEGFYGPPWSHEDRLEQLEFYSENKMNAYIYAPKDDPYHRENWRDPYPEDELNKLKELVDKANENHIEFTFSLSPGNTVCYSGDKDFELLMDKMQAVWDLGVRSYAIFLDDISYNLHCEQDQAKFGDDASPTAAAQAYLLNRFDEEFIQTHEGAESLITVPTDYAGNDSTVYRARFAELVNGDVIVMWTGSAVVPEKITSEEAEQVSEIFQHDLLIWDNYPVNDYDRNRLFLGPLVNRDGDLADHGVIGLTANPMNEAEASKIPLFTIADYTWNPKNYDPNESWERSIESFGGEAADALKTFAENNYSSPINGNESLSLKPLIKEFSNSYASGDTEEIAQELIGEFGKLEDAPDKLRNTLDNQNFLDEVAPYLEKLELYGKAGKAAVNMLKAQEEDNGEAAWKQRLILQEALTDANELSQKVAEGVIKPFLNDAIQKNNEWLEIKVTRGTSTLGIYQDYSLSNMIDGDPNTYFWSNEAANAGDAVGIDLGDIVVVESIELLMGTGGKSADYIHHGVMEYSTDGENWTALTEKHNQAEIQVETEGIEARYVRFRATENQNNWVQVREFDVKIEGEMETLPVTTMGTYQNYASTNMIDGDNNTIYWSGEHVNTGDAVGVDLGKTYTVSSVEVLMGSEASPDDYIDHGVLEYSVDGENWTMLTESRDQPEVRLDTDGIHARYIRYRALSDQDNWLQVREFRTESNKGSENVSGGPPAAEGSSLADLADASLSSAYQANRTPEAGESITLMYSSKRVLNELVILQGEQSTAKAEIQIQEQNGEWKTVGTLSGSYSKVGVGSATNKIRLAWQAGSGVPIIHEVIPQWEK
ncbi:beta-N-acetylglucosaminidase domain-containing protein [Virgibacillus necropolis]|uniref:beta-N-acetylglucosaminidase domain-containing protein n=1 Tax=Virgibacillus necropolis TaxID=163877 RepID=UPI00384B9F92